MAFRCGSGVGKNDERTWMLDLGETMTKSTMRTRDGRLVAVPALVLCVRGRVLRSMLLRF